MISPEYLSQFSSEVSRLWREQEPERTAGVEIDLTLEMQEMHAAERISALDPDPKAQAASAVQALYRAARYGTVDPHTLDAEGLRTLQDMPAHQRYCESGEPRIHADDEILSASVMMGFGPTVG